MGSGGLLSGCILSVLSGRTSTHFFDHAVKVADVLETCHVCGLLYCHRVVGEQVSGFLQSRLKKFFFGRAVKIHFIIPVKLTFSYIQNAAQLFHAPGLAAVLKHMGAERQ